MHRLSEGVIEANRLMLLFAYVVEVLLAGSPGSLVEGRVERVLQGWVYDALV